MGTICVLDRQFDVREKKRRCTKMYMELSHFSPRLNRFNCNYGNVVRINQACTYEHVHED